MIDDMKKYLFVILIIVCSILLYQLLQNKIDLTVDYVKNVLINSNSESSNNETNSSHACIHNNAPSSLQIPNNEQDQNIVQQDQIVLEDTENYDNLDNEYMLSCDSGYEMTEEANYAIFQALREVN